PGERQFLLAGAKRTGREAWRREVAGGNAGADPSNWRGSWSTPSVIRVNDHDELILPVPEQLKGLDPKTGEELWRCDGLGKLVYTSPVRKDAVGVAMSGSY